MGRTIESCFSWSQWEPSLKLSLEKYSFFIFFIQYFVLFWMLKIWLLDFFVKWSLLSYLFTESILSAKAVLVSEQDRHLSLCLVMLKTNVSTFIFKTLIHGLFWARNKLFSWFYSLWFPPPHILPNPVLAVIVPDGVTVFIFVFKMTFQLGCLRQSCCPQIA